MNKIEATDKQRCGWVAEDPLYTAYHDEEWGVPLHDDCRLFEFLVLESAQAGLSWITILKRREGYRDAYRDFVVDTVAAFGAEDVERLVADTSIIRNRQKILASITNAQVFHVIQKEFGSFSSYVWEFVDGSPVRNSFTDSRQVPSQTTTSQKLSVDLRKRGMQFIGPTIMYAYMQAVGLVNDHLVSCFRYNQIQTGEDTHEHV